MDIFAEVKTGSPFGYEAQRSWDELFEIALRIGHTISVHTDPRWGGSFDLLRRARDLTDKPLLAKGIHATDDEVKQAVDCGANWVLIVGRVPRVHLVHCLPEPYTLQQLANQSGAIRRAVWNSRDLVTGGLKTETFDQARTLYPHWLCQASNISSLTQVHPTADAILVGQHLEQIAAELDSGMTLPSWVVE